MRQLSGVIDLDAYREEADRFIAALDEEYYLHFAGIKESFELSPIYERYSDLTALDACERLGATAAEENGGVKELWRFACEGYLGDLTSAEEEEIAQAESNTTALVDGEAIGFRMLKPTIANEQDRDRRERLERAREDLAREHLDPLYRRAADLQGEGVVRLGAESYRRLYDRFGFPLEVLAGQCLQFLSETEDLYADVFERLLREKIGVGVTDVRRWDVPRLFRATEWDAGFPAAGMLPALEATLAGLGIDLHAQQNVHLDMDARTNKSPRAFCAPIEVPGRVVLVIQPIGGPDDWHALFHEAGHTEHFAHTAAGLPTEARRLGDNAVTEGWAALFELLVSEPAWLAHRLDFGRPREFAAEAAAKQLYIVRRYCGKLLYEIELHSSGDLEGMPERYVERIGEATKVDPSPVDFLSDVDDGFYVSSYLRSWAFEAQMRAFLAERFGTTWFSRREAGGILRELWYEGQSMNADELLRQVTGTGLEMAAIGERIREAL
jgi:hypothetical protein